MDPQGCENRTTRVALSYALGLAAALSAALAPVNRAAAQQPRLQRLPPAHTTGRANYDARDVLQNTWDEPGMSWFAPWRTYADEGDGLVNAYQETMFQDPHAEDVPPPPPSGVVDESPGGALPEGETIGEEPEDYNVQFLRQQSVLLNHGDWQLDYGIQYAYTEDDLPLATVDGGGNVTGVVETNSRNRLLLTPVEFRYGVTDRAQAFVNVPMGWSHSEVSFTDFDEFESQLGIGDVSAGLSILLCNGCQYQPDVITTLSFTAPTGNPDFPLLNTLSPNSVLGQGFWGASAQLLFIHTIDPVVLFWGFGYEHRFEEDFANTTLGIQQDIRPGETAFYQCGVGFGVNERITLSTSFAGAYISELHIDGDRVEGSILEPMRLRFAVTIATEAKLIEPFTEIGMTNDSVDARFGITWTHTQRHNSRYGY